MPQSLSLAQYGVLHTNGQCSPVSSIPWDVQWLYKRMPPEVLQIDPTAWDIQRKLPCWHALPRV